MIFSTSETFRCQGCRTDLRFIYIYFLSEKNWSILISSISSGDHSRPSACRMPSHKLFGFQNHRENSCGQRPAFVAIGWSHKLGQDTIHQNYVWSLWLVFRHHSNHVNTCDLSDSLTRAVNLKRVQNFRFIYRIQWKIREFTWFIYLQEWLTQLPALYQSNLPSPAPCAELTRLSSTKRRSNVVLPVPGLPQTSGWWCKREGHNTLWLRGS